MGREPLRACARWINDCQGKKSYNGRLISISTRYWPGASSGEGSLVFDNTPKVPPRDIKFETLPYGRNPSAHSSIVLNCGEPDEDGYGEEQELVEKKFEAETEAEVKAQVEAWVHEQFIQIHLVLTNHFHQADRKKARRKTGPKPKTDC